MFCGVCEPEGRDNENLLAKATWFGGGERLGTHEVSFGLDTFDDVRLSDNHQSASDYALFATASIIRDGVIYPVFIGGDSESALIVYFPILRGSEGTSFKTNSAYLNDRWRLGERVSLNLGVRYDENDGQDAEGKLVADDSRVSPRLGLSWDLRGDGDWLVNFGYGHYVDALANNIGDASSSAGTPAILVWLYAGPDINGPGMPLVPTHDAMARVFADWDSRGGAADRTLLVQETIPGETVVIDGTLHSPYVEEWTLGVGQAARQPRQHPQRPGQPAVGRLLLDPDRPHDRHHAERRRPRTGGQSRRLLASRPHLHRAPQHGVLPHRPLVSRRHLDDLQDRGQLRRRDGGLRTGAGHGRAVPGVQAGALELADGRRRDRSAAPRAGLGGVGGVAGRAQPPQSVGAAELLQRHSLRCGRVGQPPRCLRRFGIPEPGIPVERPTGERWPTSTPRATPSTRPTSPRPTSA